MLFNRRDLFNEVVQISPFLLREIESKGYIEVDINEECFEFLGKALKNDIDLDAIENDKGDITPDGFIDAVRLLEIEPCKHSSLELVFSKIFTKCSHEKFTGKHIDYEPFRKFYCYHSIYRTNITDFPNEFWETADPRLFPINPENIMRIVNKTGNFRLFKENLWMPYKESIFEGWNENLRKQVDPSWFPSKETARKNFETFRKNFIESFVEEICFDKSKNQIFGIVNEIVLFKNFLRQIEQELYNEKL